MLYSLAIIGITLILAFFLLPTRIALNMRRRVDHHGLSIAFSWSFFDGLCGLYLRMQNGERRLFPLVAGRPIGLLSLRLADKSKSLKSTSKSTSKSTPERKADKKKPGIPLLQRLSFLKDLLLRPARRFLRRLQGPFALYKFRLQGHLGFSDPAKTGKLCGYIYSLNGFNNKRLYIAIQPDFTTPGLRGQLQFVIRFHLGYLLFLILALVLEIGLRWLILRLVPTSWRPGFI